MTKRVLVLHSGGMDSTTCLYAAKKSGCEVYSLGVDYGQRLSIELMFAKRQCEAIGVPREVIHVQWSKPDRPIPTDRSVAEMSKTISPAFLPSRNVVFLSLAMAHAAGIGADEVQIGLNCVDFSGYPDCTVEFFESFSATNAIANPGGATLAAPLLRMSKREIAAMANGLGLGEHDTWSCYRPQIVNGGVQPCGQCDACLLHAHAWQGLG
jgi:7-cyano-7-deazaguanine synthase